MLEKSLFSLDKKTADLIYYLVKDSRSDMETISTLFHYFTKNGDFGIKYSMESAEKYRKVKLPLDVVKTKFGHCFELSLFMVAVLDIARRKGKLKAKPFYVEVPDLVLDDKLDRIWDHACVGIRFNGVPKRYVNRYMREKGLSSRFKRFGIGELLLLDPGRNIFGAQYHTKHMRPLSGKKLLANYYFNCASMLFPKKKRDALSLIRKGLKLDPTSWRGKDFLRYALK